MSGIARFIINRGEPATLPTAARNYSGTLYAVRFMVDKPVTIGGVSFYGPNLGLGTANVLPGVNSHPTRQIYVRLEFKQSVYHNPNIHDGDLQKLSPMRMFSARIPTDGPRGRVFTIELPNPVHIPSQLLVEAKFELMGADENDGITFFRLPDDHPPYQTVLHPESGVEWSFFMSSKQLAGFLFSIQETQEQMMEELQVARRSCQSTQSVGTDVSSESEFLNTNASTQNSDDESLSIFNNAPKLDENPSRKPEHIYEEILERIEQRANRFFLQRVKNDACIIS